MCSFQITVENQEEILNNSNCGDLNDNATVSSSSANNGTFCADSNTTDVRNVTTTTLQAIPLQNSTNATCTVADTWVMEYPEVDVRCYHRK